MTRQGLRALGGDFDLVVLENVDILFLSAKTGGGLNVSRTCAPASIEASESTSIIFERLLTNSVATLAL